MPNALSSVISIGSLLVVLAGGAISALPAGATGENPSTKQPIENWLQSNQPTNGLGVTCSPDGKVVGLSEQLIQSLKNAGYTVDQINDYATRVKSPSANSNICLTNSADSKSEAAATAAAKQYLVSNPSAKSNQKVVSNHLQSLGFASDIANSVATTLTSSNNATGGSNGAITAGNSADRYESNSVVNPRGGINTDLSVGIGLNVNLLQKVQACDSVVIMGNGALAKVIKDVAKHAFYDRQAWSRFYEPLRDKFMAGEIQSEEFSAKIGKWKIASAVNADELRTQYGDDLIKIAQLCSNKPVTPPGNPPANPPVYREVPPPSTLQACFEVGEKQYEIRTWSSLEAQPGFKKVQNGLCFGRLGALPTVPSLQFVS